MFTRTDRYMARQIVVPLLVTLAVAAALLLLERMLRIFDLVVNQGGPFLVVWEMLAALVPHYLGQAIPFGLFLGVLLAFRKLSLNNEIDAFQAAGQGLPRLIRPAVGIAIVLAVANFLLTNYLQPYGRYTYRNLEFELRSGAFGASVRVGEFNQVGNGVTIRVNRIFEGGNRLTGIFVEKEYPRSNRVTAITAREGTVLSAGDDQTLLLRLYDGLLLDMAPGRPTPTVLSFEMQDWPITLPEIEPFRTRGGGEREMTLGELWTAVQENAGTSQGDTYRAALHNRFVIALSVLVIPFLATPFGFMAKRTGRAFGLAVGFGIVLLYNKVIEFGQAFAALGGASPWLTLWGPFALYAGAVGYLYWQSAFKVGANPFAWLEVVWNAMHDLYLRFIPSASSQTQ